MRQPSGRPRKASHDPARHRSRFRSEIPEGERTQRLKDRLTAAGEPVVGTTIITVEEQMRGWLAAIAKERQPKRQIAAYRNLAELFEFFSQFHIALWDDAAVASLEQLPGRCRRIGMMDRKAAR